MRSAKRKYAILVNRKSNSGRGIRKFESFKTSILNTLEDAELFYVGEGESLSEIAKNQASHFDVIIACGGDGTVKNVASGLIDTNATLGVLPFGSGNDFAKMLGIAELNISEQLQIIKRESTRKVDLIRVNDEITTNTYGIGFSGYTNYLASNSKVKGPLKYIWAGIIALMSSRPAGISIKSDEIEFRAKTRLVALANGKWEGGRYLISDQSDHSDGEMEVLILKPVSIARLAFVFIKLSMGGTLSSSILHSYKAQKLRIKTDNKLYAHSDGEVIDPLDTFEVHLLPAAINVISY